MGREAYLMRLALGRSPLEPPEDSDTFTAARAGDWISALHAPGDDSVPGQSETMMRAIDPPHNEQLYDARGHPFNPWARTSGRRLIEAQNDILSVIGVTERKIPIDGPHDFNHDLMGQDIDPDEDLAGDLIGNAADFDYQFLSWWIHAFTNRLLVFPPTSDTSFVDLLKLHHKVIGTTQTMFGTLESAKFMFAGLPSFMLSHLINPEMWTQYIVYSLDRAIMASVSSREWRETYMRIRPAIAAVVEVFLNLFVLPFRLHSMLQLLGFAPESIFGLPHPRSWVPFFGSSLIRWDWSVRPILPFFAYRPLSSFVHRYLYMSCRPAIMEPVNMVHHRRSSGSRFATSVNSAPLIELPNVETALTGIFRTVFGFLGWGHPSYVSEAPAPFWNPGLRRRETWPVEHDTNTDAPETEQTQDATTQTRDMAPLEPITPVTTNHDNPQENNSPIETHRDDTDATIRVSSIDPETGAVNLEIGLPDMGDDHQQLYAEPARRQDTDLFKKPHRVSRLALEPTELLASLANGWIAGWLLMPLRAMVLRNLVRHVIVNPGLFGVDAARARALPRLFGSDFGLVKYGNTSGVGKVALSCLVDVGLGMGFWLVEWAVVRGIGVYVFEWGTF